MIPEKLYIPTSTLNFNNIMSSESISPVSFYLNRGFGYKRFEKVAPNPLNSRIILYKNFPVFAINEKELDNYPMVIEIDTKFIQENVIKEHNEIYYSDETIYLNPFTTKFIFINNNELVSTISKEEPAIEAKMVPIYRNCFVTLEEYNINSKFEWNPKVLEDSKLEDSKEDNTIFISKDRRINKLKGFLYAYLIASKKSVSPDIVSLKKLTRNLKNLLSAIITSPDGRSTDAQEEQLKTLYKSINDLLQNIFISPIIKEKSEKYKCDFYSILIQENLWEDWLRRNNLIKYQIKPFDYSYKEKDKAFKFYIHNVDNLISEIEQGQKTQVLDVTNLPYIQNYRIINIPGHEEILSKLFNEYLEEAYNSAEFIQSRYEFARAGGKIFKDELKEQWNGSHSQQYINDLLKNLNEYSAFDLKSTNNLTLVSFAAFCQKGESDIEKLEDYLIMNEIGDFRIAFSLWGIVFGFANMPKTLTNELFQSDDLEYVTRIYKHIFKLIHSKDLVGNLEKPRIMKQTEETKPEEPEQASGKDYEKHSSTKTYTQDIHLKISN